MSRESKATLRQYAALGFFTIGIGSIGGCRNSSPAPADAFKQAEAGPAASASTAAAAVVDAAAPEPFVPRFPTAVWANWPMPNSPTPGLPNQQSFDTRVPGVVVDQITGLMWQREVANKFLTFDEAGRECDQSKLAGYEDWRLPSRLELESIADTTRNRPSIDPNVFPNTPVDWFWTSSVAADNPRSAWYIYFYFGYPKTDDKHNLFSVRCVREAVKHEAPKQHYDIQAATVRDLGTGLLWQRAVPDKKFPFGEAQNYCKQLNLAGKKGWRVPTLPELLTLIDERATTVPLIDQAAFPNTPSEQFWTSTVFANSPITSWYVFFNRGDGLYGMNIEKYRARCVI